MLGDQPDVLSDLDSLLRSQGAEIVEQSPDAEEFSDDLGRRTDVIFVEAVGYGGHRWKERIHDVRRRLPGARVVLVARGPGKALDAPAALEGADGLVHYPIQPRELVAVLTRLFPAVQFPPARSHVSGGYAGRRRFF